MSVSKTPSREARLDVAKVTPGLLAEAIDSVQRNAHAGRADSRELAVRVIDQLERADRCAEAVGIPLARLAPSAIWWEDDGNRQASGKLTTLVQLVGYPACEVVVRRAAPPVSTSNGRLTLVIP